MVKVIRMNFIKYSILRFNFDLNLKLLVSLTKVLPFSTASMRSYHSLSISLKRSSMIIYQAQIGLRLLTFNAIMIRTFLDSGVTILNEFCIHEGSTRFRIASLVIESIIMRNWNWWNFLPKKLTQRVPAIFDIINK